MEGKKHQNYISLRHYQKLVIEEVKNKVNEGNSRISIAMTAGLGLSLTALFIANAFNTSRVAFVVGTIEAKHQFRYLVENYGDFEFECITVNDILYKNFNLDSMQYYFLFDLGVWERCQLSKIFKSKNKVIISIFNPVGQITSRELHIMRKNQPQHIDYEKLGIIPQILLYYTTKAIDVRDVIDTEYEEKQLIKKQVLFQTNNLLENVKKLDAEQEVTVLKQQVNELLQLIDFQQKLLESFGIPSEKVYDSFIEIQIVRDKLSDRLKSSDEHDRELAIAELQNAVSTIISEMALSNSKNYIGKYEELLKRDFGKENWEKLDEKTKMFLITAKVNYSSMASMKHADKYDYSGVCLLVTKAVEVELSKRYCKEYINYLTQVYGVNYSKWPRHIMDKDGNPISESEFTLGTFMHIAGFGYDGCGNIIVRNRYCYRTLIEFCRNALFNAEGKKRIEGNVADDIEFVERIRLNYRNPAAHKDELTRISASECLDYVVEVQKRLKLFLNHLNH